VVKILFAASFFVVVLILHVLPSANTVGPCPLVDLKRVKTHCSQLRLASAVAGRCMYA
jgi:hypothetical protein